MEEVALRLKVLDYFSLHEVSLTVEAFGMSKYFGKVKRKYSERQWLRIYEAFPQVVKREKVVHFFNCSRRSQSNGYIERFNRSLKGEFCFIN